MNADATLPPPIPAFSAFLAGIKAAFLSVFVVVNFGTFLGIGALGHDLDFSLAWVIICTLLLWAGPAQVILISALASGAALIEVAIAVTLSGVRLLPLVMSLVPVMRGPNTRTVHLLLPAHFIAVTIWAEGLRLLPGLARENRIPFINGIGVGFSISATLATAIGFMLAARLPMVLTAALLMLTPLAFLMSIAGNARMLSDRIAIVLGLIICPVLAYYHVGLDLLWGGLAGGSLGYLVQRLRKRPA